MKAYSGSQSAPTGPGHGREVNPGTRDPLGCCEPPGSLRPKPAAALPLPICFGERF